MIVKNIDSEYDKKTKTATVTITDNKNRCFTGTTVCEPEDYDFESEKVGYTIAYNKAVIKLIKRLKADNQFQLDALNHLYNSIRQSNSFHPDGYESKMLKRHIQLKEEEISCCKDVIKTMGQDLIDYCEMKDDFHAAVKRIRKGKNS